MDSLLHFNSAHPFSVTKTMDITKTRLSPRGVAIAVKIAASLGIVFVASFETWHALTSTITWRDWAHYVAATGAICFLAAAIKNGRWRISQRISTSSKQ